MATQGGEAGEDVYATLLLTDTYLPGALVLAHSLRDAGTTKKLAVLVTSDTVSAEVVTQLETVYDHVIPVPRIQNDQTANLYLMGRPDLQSAFTKINLWKLTQFRRIVYIDADVVAYRAPEELFDLPHPFAAAPDIGWPDLFNTGVMALTPNMGDYYAMMAMAERGISFDGADQGLLNMHFKNTFHRLPFTYNVTPSAHYQYIPAYRHFQASINMVHFIGTGKPWQQGREAYTSGSPFDEMVGRWWAVYDRHYRNDSETNETKNGSKSVPDIIRYFVKGEFNPNTSRYAGQENQSSHSPLDCQQDHQNLHDTQQVHHAPATTHDAPVEQHHTHFNYNITSDFVEDAHTEAREGPSGQTWDAQRQSPPHGSRPEALNFPSAHYDMSSDTSHFVAPDRYPSPPKNMWYNVPKEQERPKPIFPWEKHQPKPSRVFAHETPRPITPPQQPSIAVTTEQSSAYSGSPESKAEPETPTMTSYSSTGPPVPQQDIWSSFPRTNAWDGVPEIERYADALQQKHRRTNSRGLRMPMQGASQEQGQQGQQGRTVRVTDFPSEDDRPSLPVTPAPIHGGRFWGGSGAAGGTHDNGDGEERWDEPEESHDLPAAEGVPEQSEWDPVAQLQKLAKQQSEMLLHKLGGTDNGSGNNGGGLGAAFGASNDSNSSNSTTARTTTISTASR